MRANRCLSEDWLVRSSVIVSHVKVASRNHLDTNPSIQTPLSECRLPNNCEDTEKKNKFGDGPIKWVKRNVGLSEKNHGLR